MNKKYMFGCVGAVSAAVVVWLTMQDPITYCRNPAIEKVEEQLKENNVSIEVYNIHDDLMESGYYEYSVGIPAHATVCGLSAYDNVGGGSMTVVYGTWRDGMKFYYKPIILE